MPFLNIAIFTILCNIVCMVPDAYADNLNSSLCEEGWKQYGDEYCLKSFSSPENWFTASNSCINNGGHLASVHSKEHNDISKDAFMPLRIYTTWIGLHVDSDNKYAWVDGTKVDYTNWDHDEPDGGFPSGDCVLVIWSSLRNGLWYVYPCIREFPYFCQKKVPTAISASTEMDDRPVTTTAIIRTEMENIPDTTIEVVSPCEDGWKHLGDEYCHKVHEIRANWKDASARCIRMGGHLPSIHSKEENDRFKEFSKESGIEYWWIGLHDNDLDSKYVWDDGTDVDYVNWRSDEPDGGYTFGGDCVATRNTGYMAGKWYVLPCLREVPYLCQKKIPTNITTSTELDNISASPSVTESDETVTINLPVFITTSKKSVNSDCIISVTTYIIIVIVIVFLALIGGMLYYKRFWLEEKRLKVSMFFRRR